MRLGNLLGVMVLAGALGAVAGGAMSLLMQGGDEPEENEILDRLAEIQREVDGLRDAVRDGRKGVGDLEERLVSAQMDLNRMVEEAAAARARAPRGPGGNGSSVGLPTIEMPSISIPEVRMPHFELDPASAEMASELAAEAQARATELRNRFAKSMELRSLPEDERWAKATDELGLTTAQVNEIKAAKEEFDAAMKEAVTSETKTTSDGATMTFRSLDGNKMREARTRLDERVDNTLNTEQQDRWNKEGWKGAMTGSGPAHPGSGMRIRRRTSSGADGAGGEVEVVARDIVVIEAETDEPETDE